MNKSTVVTAIVAILLGLAVVAVTSYSAGLHQRELDIIHGQLSTEIDARKELELRVRRIEERRNTQGVGGNQ